MQTVQDVILSKGVGRVLSIDADQREALAAAPALILFHEPTRHALTEPLREHSRIHQIEFNHDVRQFQLGGMAVYWAAALAADLEALPAGVQRDVKVDGVLAVPPVTLASLGHDVVRQDRAAARDLLERSWVAFNFAIVNKAGTPFGFDRSNGRPTERQIAIDLASNYATEALALLPKDERDSLWSEDAVALQTVHSGFVAALGFARLHSDKFPQYKQLRQAFGTLRASGMTRLGITVGTQLAAAHRRGYVSPFAAHAQLAIPQLDKFASAQLDSAVPDPTPRQPPVQPAPRQAAQRAINNTQPTPVVVPNAATPRSKPDTAKFGAFGNDKSDVIGQMLNGDVELARQHPRQGLLAMALIMWDAGVKLKVRHQEPQNTVQGDANEADRMSHLFALQRAARLLAASVYAIQQKPDEFDFSVSRYAKDDTPRGFPPIAIGKVPVNENDASNDEMVRAFDELERSWLQYAYALNGDNGSIDQKFLTSSVEHARTAASLLSDDQQKQIFDPYVSYVHSAAIKLTHELYAAWSSPGYVDDDPRQNWVPRFAQWVAGVVEPREPTPEVKESLGDEANAVDKPVSITRLIGAAPPPEIADYRERYLSASMYQGR